MRRVTKIRNRKFVQNGIKILLCTLLVTSTHVEKVVKQPMLRSDYYLLIKYEVFERNNSVLMLQKRVV